MAAEKEKNDYFNEINRDILVKRRSLLNRKRAQCKIAFRKKSHWMICPKCGGQMKETMVSKVCIDQCQRCNGVYFDAEEFKTLTMVKKRKSFLDYLNKAFEVNPKWQADL